MPLGVRARGLTDSNPYGFKASFNPTFPERLGNPHAWVSPWHFGIRSFRPRKAADPVSPGHRERYTAMVATLFLASAGCASDTTGPAAFTPAIVSVAPAAGATDISVTAPVVVTFSHAMGTGMATEIVLHEVSLAGTAVAGSASWSTDRTSLTFVPAAALQPLTTYVLHLAPVMTTADGGPANHGACGQGRSGGMMGGGMMGGGMMGSGTTGMMGAGWKMADGSYDMTFSFTTG